MLNFYEMLQVPWNSPEKEILQAIKQAEKTGKIRSDLISAIRWTLTDKQQRHDYDQRLAAYYDELDKQQ